MTVRPDSSIRARVDGHEVVTYSYGNSLQEVLILVNGGTELSREHRREAMLRIVEAGSRVAAYDRQGAHSGWPTSFLDKHRG